MRALEVGRREDGLSWLVRLHGIHVLVAGATGAGKASLLWGLVRAMFPLMHDGLVRVLAADPKLMELAFGQPFVRQAGYGAQRLPARQCPLSGTASSLLRAAQTSGKRRSEAIASALSG